MTSTVAPPGVLSPAYRACTLALSGTFVLVAFAGLALSTVMPIAVQELDGLGLYALAFGGFLTTGIIGTVLAGGWADRRGPAPALCAGLLCFSGGALLSGLAATMSVFLVGRYLQGFGGGAVTVALYVVVGRAYPTGLRPRMFSLITACWIVPSMVGPPVAGVVAETLSWHWVFHGIAFLAVLALVLLARPLSRLRTVGAPEEEGGGGEGGPVSGLGVVPALAVALGAGLLQYAGTPSAPYRLPAAVVGLVLLVVQLRPLLPAGTLRARRGIPSLVLLRGVAAGAYFTIETYIPLMLVNERQWSPGAAGMSLTGAALTWFAASWLQGRPRLPWPRERVVLVGALIHGAGAALTLSGTLRAMPAVTVAVGLLVAGFGMGLLLPGVGVLTLERSPTDQQGRNSASLQLSDSLSSVLLVVVCGALFNMAHVRAGQDTAAFAAVFGTALAVAAAAGPVARRITPPHPEEKNLATL
ncbi:MFS transporter [Streptomyces sp. BG9H]|uniref:MFS transporter n=1 Tax=Streptomyces anatolicus TaxID=2675858 RepID=A0ABS6YRG7_9ACTN|nr:MFS transporter [Streptomyces anatolicus]MBW5423161.1 MFS transporter [Streptomyces anatolicus]